MNTVYLIVGGNKGDRMQNLNQALFLIEKSVGSIIKKSKIYQTAAWGNTDQPDFLNRVICIRTHLSPDELLKELIFIEEYLGRVRSEKKWMERTLDIDILFYNDEVIDTSDLKVPHPYIDKRRFVLLPLTEIAPMLIHPVLKKDVETLLLECGDMLQVRIY